MRQLTIVNRIYIVTVANIKSSIWLYFWRSYKWAIFNWN